MTDTKKDVYVEKIKANPTSWLDDSREKVEAESEGEEEDFERMWPSSSWTAPS